MLFSFAVAAVALNPNSAVAHHRLSRSIARSGYAPVAFAPERKLDGDVLTIDVARSESGALGIQVDETNTVATNDGQQGVLMLGDVIIAVDGEELDGRPIGTVISKKDSYIFTVRRDIEKAAGSLERVLLNIARDAPVNGKALCTFDDLQNVKGGLGDKALELVDALEKALEGAPPVDEETLYSHAGLLGFWRLRLTTDVRISTDGFTGFGGAPMCTLHASYALLQTAKEPTAQLVEVVGQQGIGQHGIAALKGEWTAETASGLTLSENFNRLEFVGSPQVGADPVSLERPCTYLGEHLRICRQSAMVTDPDGVESSVSHVYVYERQSADVAQGEISRLLELPVPRPPPTCLEDLGDLPLWERRGGSGGGGGYSPDPQADAPRM